MTVRSKVAAGIERTIPTRPQKLLTFATLVNTVGNGIYMAAGVLYFVREVGLPSTQVGLGLSIAGSIALLAGIPAGRLADRISPKGVYSFTLVLRGAAVLWFCFIGDFWAFILAASLSGIAQNAGNAAKGPIIRQHGGHRPQSFRAFLRSITNIGVSAGAVGAGVAIQVDTPTAYRILFLLAAVAFTTCAVLVLFMPPAQPTDADIRPSWVALRDRPFMALTALDGVLSVEFQILSFALPLWLVTFAYDQRWLISASLILNTAVVILFQVRASKRVDSPEAGASALRRAGLAFLLACIAFSFSANVPGWLTVVLVLLAIVVHTFGELLHSAGQFELSFGLAPAHAQGQYQGLFGMGAGLAQSYSPAVLTLLCINLGQLGWLIIGTLLAIVGLAAPIIVRWAVATRPIYFDPDTRRNNA